jgi:hypothetical protein
MFFVDKTQWRGSGRDARARRPNEPNPPNQQRPADRERVSAPWAARTKRIQGLFSYLEGIVL